MLDLFSVINFLFCVMLNAYSRALSRVSDTFGCMRILLHIILNLLASLCRFLHTNPQNISQLVRLAPAI